MKKFCSTCGNQLKLSQRFCNDCGAVNPFFVAAFTLLSDQRESLEKLRLEKERIEKELAAKEEAQKEFERQENLRKGVEDEKQKEARLEQERIQRETAERERIEANLKREILQVKEEAEQYKKETINLVREVRKEVKEEIQHIEQENKRLKLEVDLLSSHLAEKNEPVNIAAPPVVQPIIEQKKEVEPIIVTPEPVSEPEPETIIEEPVIIAEEPEVAPEETEEPQSSSGGSRTLRVVLAVVLLLGGILAYFYFTNIRQPETASDLATDKTQLAANSSSSATTDRVVDTTLASDPPVSKEDTLTTEPMKVSPAVLTAGSKPAVVKKTAAVSPSMPASPPVEKPVAKPSAKLMITEAKVKTDLNGKKISGCGVTIGSDAQLQSMGNLVMVEKSANYTKYKCTIKLAQGSDTYTAVPYLYYSDAGVIIKVDGTNCE